MDQAAEWELVTQLRAVLRHLAADETLPTYWDGLVRVVLAHHNWWKYTQEHEEKRAALTVVETLLADANVEDFLQIHVHNGVTWFNQEMFELMIDWLMVVGAWHELTAAVAGGKRIGWTNVVAETQAMAEVYKQWRAAERASGFRVDELLKALEMTPAAPSGGSGGTRGKKPEGTTGAKTPKTPKTTKAPKTSAGRSGSGKKTKNDKGSDTKG